MGITQRLKNPLIVADQRRLIENASERREKPLIILILSTGIHPAVLADVSFDLEIDKDYYSYHRPKSRKLVTGSWSKMAKSHLEAIRRLRGLNTRSYWYFIRHAGERVGIPSLGPLRLRHTYFVNRARLGKNVWEISEGAGTNQNTVGKYYMIGQSEMDSLSDSDKVWLKELMER